MKTDKIRVETSVRNYDAFIEKTDITSESCPFYKLKKCLVDKNITCRYGLTEIHVPKKCPLRKDIVIKTVVAKLLIHK